MSCKSKKSIENQSNYSEPSGYLQIGKNKYGESFDLLYNKTKSHVCVFQVVRNRPDDIYANVNFFIYDINKDQIVFEDVQINRGKIKWIKEHILETEKYIGRIRDSNKRANKTWYHVLSKKRTMAH